MTQKKHIHKVALVTGASSGIGFETAKLLLQDNFKVYVAARRVEKMEQLVELGAVPIAMDLTFDETIIKAIDQITSECGKLDVLINNAGYGSYGSLEDMPISEAKNQFEVNVFGLARLTQLALPLMRQQKKVGLSISHLLVGRLESRMARGITHQNLLLKDLAIALEWNSNNLVLM
jgi:NAD(P)-dependent dehydrogenase (short-subunit alcohol dehydrogenase family)